MHKLHATYLLVIAILIYGCSSDVLELRSVPSLDQWQDESVKAIYHPREISHEVVFDDIEMYLLFSNYATEYRGTNLFSVSISEEPNVTPGYDDEWLVLSAGIRLIDADAELQLEPYKTRLLSRGPNGTTYTSPSRVYQLQDGVRCGFDYYAVGSVWGGDSVELESEQVVAVHTSKTDGRYTCLNILFEAEDSLFEDDLAVDFSAAGLADQVVYFHTKRIRWTSSK